MRVGRGFIALALALVMLGGCKGAEGPAGPAGPKGDPGPQGPPGPAAPAGATVYTVTGTIAADGTASALLPSSVSSASGFPSLACYVSNDRQAWLLIATDVDPALACGIVRDGTDMAVSLIGATGMTYYYFVVTYLPGS